MDKVVLTKVSTNNNMTVISPAKAGVNTGLPPLSDKVRKAGAAGLLVLAADVVPDVDRHDRRLAVGVHHHAQAVGQGELLEGDVGLHGGFGLCDGGRFGGNHRREAGDGEAEGEHERAQARLAGLGHAWVPVESVRDVPADRES